jgi:hypothetical protein
MIPIRQSRVLSLEALFRSNILLYPMQEAAAFRGKCEFEKIQGQPKLICGLVLHLHKPHTRPSRLRPRLTLHNLCDIGAHIWRGSCAIDVMFKGAYNIHFNCDLRYWRQIERLRR